jgi:hypothetical protein
MAGVLLPLTGCARIAGEVTVQGRPAEGVVLLIGEFSTITNSAGGYSVWVQRPWSGTVAIPRYGPLAKIAYENVTEDRLDQHWCIRLTFKEISGWVTDGTVTPEAPLAGVTMEIRGEADGNGDTYARDVVTDENGLYAAPVPNGYEITIENYTPPASAAPPAGPDPGTVATRGSSDAQIDEAESAVRYGDGGPDDVAAGGGERRAAVRPGGGLGVRPTGGPARYVQAIDGDGRDGGDAAHAVETGRGTAKVG